MLSNQVLSLAISNIVCLQGCSCSCLSGPPPRKNPTSSISTPMTWAMANSAATARPRSRPPTSTNLPPTACGSPSTTRAAPCARRDACMTGIDSGRAYIRNNSPWYRKTNPHNQGQEPLKTEYTTIAELLKSRATALASQASGPGRPESYGPRQAWLRRFLWLPLPVGRTFLLPGPPLAQRQNPLNETPQRSLQVQKAQKTGL